jgi:hypothetical protein
VAKGTALVVAARFETVRLMKTPKLSEATRSPQKSTRTRPDNVVQEDLQVTLESVANAEDQGEALLRAFLMLFPEAAQAVDATHLTKTDAETIN